MVASQRYDDGQANCYIPQYLISSWKENTKLLHCQLWIHVKILDCVHEKEIAYETKNYFKNQ